MTYNQGDRVQRIEAIPITGAVVLTVLEFGEEQTIELSYDEGGTGWWPASCVNPELIQ
jgi:hypothetical protein